MEDQADRQHMPERFRIHVNRGGTDVARPLVAQTVAEIVRVAGKSWAMNSKRSNQKIGSFRKPRLVAASGPTAKTGRREKWIPHLRGCAAPCGMTGFFGVLFFALQNPNCDFSGDKVTSLIARAFLDFLPARNRYASSYAGNHSVSSPACAKRRGKGSHPRGVCRAK